MFWFDELNHVITALLFRAQSSRVEVAWISDEEKKKKLRKLTLNPKTRQNASFGPWKWWM